MSKTSEFIKSTCRHDLCCDDAKFPSEEEARKNKIAILHDMTCLLQKEDMVSHPAHYQVKDMTYEPIKVINAWDLNFNIGSAVKYLARYKKKFNAIEDLKKAIFYIQDEINHLEQQKKEEKSI